MLRQSNILDPISAELSPLVFDHPASDKPILKPVHAHWIKSQIYKTLEDGGYTDVEKWLTLVLTGSICTYQYSSDSDIDVSLFVDSKIFPEWSRAEMIALMVDKMDGRMLPGTQFPMQDFVVGEGIKPSDLYKPGLRSGYNIDNGKWIVPPEKSRVHDVKAEEGGFYAWGLSMADKMERLLRYEPEQAVQFWHQIHAKRQRDMRAGKGDFAESNVVYKFLANRGLFPQLSEASGEYIAKTAGAPVKPPRLRQGSPTKNCLSCKMYHKNKGGRGKCWGYGEYDVRGDQLCDSYEKETRNLLNKFTKTAAPYDRQVAKFVYDPQANHLLLGQMGREEGENLTHDQLRGHPVWGEGLPPQTTWGTIGQNGYAEAYGGHSYHEGYKTEEAVRRAIPGTKFINPREMLHPEWAIEDPKVTYVGEPPTIRPAEEEDKRWNFQAKVDLIQVAQRIYEGVKNGSGSTINLHGEAPHTRYGFAPDLATQTPISLETFSPKDVLDFIGRFSDRLADPEKFVGSWVQGNQVILDVSEGHDDFDTAHQRAWDGHQQALYDSVAKNDVPVRGFDYQQPTTEA